MMKKSLLALSVAAAAMGAQAADVQVYGLIDTSLSFVSSDADIAGHDRVNSFSMENAKEFGSRFGLKGSEDLGNGYKVAFVLESGIKSDDAVSTRAASSSVAKPTSTSSVRSASSPPA